MQNFYNIIILWSGNLNHSKDPTKNKDLKCEYTKKNCISWTDMVRNEEV